MKKRIIAWCLLVGFILLLVNIAVIGYQRIPSIVIYLIIAFYFLFTQKKNRDNDLNLKEKDFDNTNNED